MKLSDVFPPDGHVQRLYCATCDENLDLVFKDFHDQVSGIDIRITGLPYLRCNACKQDYLPDRSRLVIIEQHRRATEKGVTTVNITRQKITKNFGFTKIPFIYDADDYYYIPGLKRPFDIGFLTPVFFNKEVLLKYDASPTYRVKFASPTYGEIIQGDSFSIPFGINKNRRVVMWLGDIAKLPEAEQYYLRSENIDSDHAIGSEFYDGQIECIFTEPSKEAKLFSLRSEFIEACFKRFGIKIALLDDEVVNLALSFNPPVNDTEKERRHLADTLNKIYIESLDNSGLGTLLRSLGGDPKSLGSLKRLQAVLQSSTGGDITKLLSPFFVLYDLRVGYSHLTSADKAVEILKTVTDRLGMPKDSGFLSIYNRVLEELSNSLERLTELVKTSAAG
jgi:hypothetical protein